MRIKMWLPLVILALITTACDRPATEDRGPGQIGQRPTEEGRPGQMAAKPKESDVENQIKAKLESDPGLKAANLDVDANPEKNEVTLSGSVESQALRAKALELAKSAQPGLTVNDKIDVKPGETSRPG